MLDRGELEGRLDAFYYKKDFRDLEALIKTRTNKKLIHFAMRMAGGATPDKKEVQRYYTDDAVNGLPFLRVQNIKSDGTISNDFIYINKATHDGMLKRSQLQSGDLITKITGVGRMAISAVVPYCFKGNINQHSVVIKTNSRKTSEALAAFLNSDVGEKLASRRSTGGTRPALDYQALKSIPIVYNEKISSVFRKAVIKSRKLEAKAKELLDSIDTYLLDELGIMLPSYPSNSLDERVFEIDFEDIFGGRLDGLSHKPFYEDAVDAIKKSSKNYSYELLRDLITHSISGDWGDDEKNITNFDDYTQCLVLRSTEIDNTYGLNIDGERKKYRYLKNTKLDRLNTRVNDILIEKSGGSPDQPVGRVALLTADIFENDVIAFSNFIHKIRLNEKIQAEFAFNCLRTFYNKKITENMQSQTNGIRNLIMSEFLHIPIPLPKPEIQEQISKEIKLRRDKAKKLQNEAKELLDQAKKEVEKIILGENK